MKKNRSSNLIRACVLAAAVALPAVAPAQNIGLYNIVRPGVVELAGSSTNVFYSYVQTNWVGSVPPTNVWNGTIITNTFGTITNGPNFLTNALTQAVSDFDNGGFTLSFLPFSGVGTNPIGVQIFNSYDFGRTFYPSLTFTNIAPGTAPYYALTNLPLQGVTTLGFNFVNIGAAAGAAGSASNFICSLNLKSPKQQFQQAGIYTGPTTPTPSITSTNWVQ